MQRALEARIAKLEGPRQSPGAFAFNGALMVILDGNDYAKLAAAEREAETSGKALIVLRITDSKENPDQLARDYLIC